MKSLPPPDRTWTMIAMRRVRGNPTGTQGPLLGRWRRGAFGAILAAALLTSACGDDEKKGGPAPEPPRCEVTPATLDFGTVLADAASERAVVIANRGGGLLEGNVRLSCPTLRILSGGGVFSLATGESKSILLRWSPPEVDTLVCTLDLGASSCGPVPCTGIAAPRAPVCVLVPASLDFGSVVVGRPRTRSFVIHNEGTATLSGDASASCAEFEIVEGEGPFMVYAGDSLAVAVEFTPRSVSSGACVIDLGTDCAGVSCLGAGVAPPPAPEMVPVDPGTFLMGSPPFEFTRGANETQHVVTITRPMLVGIHEVTQAEWEGIMGWNPSYAPGPSRPVEMVTWYDAVAWCNERSIIDGLRPAYVISNRRFSGTHITYATVETADNTDGYRLLTEAEWERCCRALSTTAFCNGGISSNTCSPPDPNLKLVAWFHCNSDLDSHDVGGKTANEWDLHDMHGNVAEWCWDGAYPGIPDYGPGSVTDPVGSGTGRIIRGGSWRSTASGCRSAHRHANSPGTWYEEVGFRVARTQNVLFRHGGESS